MPTTYQASTTSQYNTVDISSEVDSVTSFYDYEYGSFNLWKSIGAECYTAPFNLNVVDQSDDVNCYVEFSYDTGVIIKPGVLVTIVQPLYFGMNGQSLVDVESFSYVCYGPDDSYQIGITPQYTIDRRGCDLYFQISFVCPSEVRYIDFKFYFNIHKTFGATGTFSASFCSSRPVVTLTSSPNLGIVDFPVLPNGNVSGLPNISGFVPNEFNPVAHYLNILYQQSYILNAMIIVVVVGTVSFVLFGKKR